jgi:hypothetical protein
MATFPFKVDHNKQSLSFSIEFEGGSLNLENTKRAFVFTAQV